MLKIKMLTVVVILSASGLAQASRELVCNVKSGDFAGCKVIASEGIYIIECNGEDVAASANHDQDNIYLTRSGLDVAKKPAADGSCIHVD